MNDSQRKRIEMGASGIANWNTVEALAQVVLELADQQHEWPIGESLPDRIDRELGEMIDQTRATLDRMVEENRAIFRELLPKLPTLGGGWGPQEWLRSQARDARSKHSNARAREADAIADWIDRVVALASPPQENRPEFAEVDEEETSNDAPPSGDTRSGARTRTELAELLNEGWRKLQGEVHMIDLVLDHLQAHHHATYGYRSGWIERIKVGDL